MLGQLVLFLLQVAIGWFLAPIIYSEIPVPGDFGLFLYAILFAIIVFLTGVLGAQVLRDVSQPGSATLSMSLVIALIAAAIVVFLPQIVQAFPGNTISHRAFVLAGALLGYWIKR
ncbi:MAG: hypothetical protein CTY31_07400 [Hyphomicrobium sp.]|nr:MAG: hypothetical protein CTY31_07400 [Hyphomicrobium sp.]